MLPYVEKIKQKTKTKNRKQKKKTLSYMPYVPLQVEKPCFGRYKYLHRLLDKFFKKDSPFRKYALLLKKEK